jgi:cytochrome d ubiquinol oxidase subunit II
MQRPVGYQLNGGRAQLTDTASSPYALKVMTVAAAVLFPVVLAYQAWSYHVFRNRVR